MILSQSSGVIWPGRFSRTPQNDRPESRWTSDLITKRHDDKLRKFGIIRQPKLKPVRPIDVAFEVTTSTQHEHEKVLNLPSIPLNPETTQFPEKVLHFSIQHHRSLLGDILVEATNIADKFPKETKRELAWHIRSLYTGTDLPGHTKPWKRMNNWSFRRTKEELQ
ncbi:unnamed protein product [Protopolystoma xenopodis]|uniref:Uncharacterized protein n=1 Tax=Protopolystoma xenopodis TaxID=117903 RepID=A0A448XN31_9PLAT|nr:unnamed protein product [Protopolystoma xenopodis]